MKQLERVLPYNIRTVKAVVLDTVDSVSGDAERDRETGAIVATVKVFGNESRVSFCVSAQGEEHTSVRITLTAPSPLLSQDGQSRVLNHLADSMEQLIENTYTQKSGKENVL